MGSPITTWENTEVYYSGFGTGSVGIILALAVIACFGAIWLGHRHESHSYSKMD